MKHTIILLFIITISVINFSFHSDRNICYVFINSNDQLFVEHETADISELKDLIKRFIANPTDDPNYAEKTWRWEEREYIGKYRRSKGVISIQCARSTTYQAYIDVQNEIEKAFNELRNELAFKKFRTNYRQLPKEKQKAINWAIPKSISEAEPRWVRNEKWELVRNNW